MALKKKSGFSGSRKNVWLSAVAVFLLFIVCSVFAFPKQTWNRLADNPQLSFLPHLTLADFRLGLDLQGGAHLVYEADMTAVPDADRKAALEGVRDVIERRVNAFGVSEPLVQTTITDDHYRIIIELAGVLDVTEAIKQIGETPILEFKEENPDFQAGKSADLTPEEQQQLAEKNTEEQAAAEAVLTRAKAGEDFTALVKEKTIAVKDLETNGEITNVSEGFYQSAIDDIAKNRIADGQVLPQWYETANGLEVLKLLDRNAEAKDMQLSHILVCYAGATGCASDRDQTAAKQLIDSVLAQVTVENFAELAQQYTDDPGSKENGGDLDWLKQGETVPEFDRAAQALAVGTISAEAVESPFGYHVIYKRGERPYTAYHLQRLVMKKTTAADIHPSDQWKHTELSGKDLKSASVVFEQNTNRPEVQLQFNDAGAELFAQLTEANIGKRMAIFLDGQVISAPTVQQKISGGQAVITGQSSLEEAKLLAQRLNAGALPVAVTLISQQTVGPTLGQASLDASIEAGLIGFALVALFMILYYRLPGVLAVVALLGYASINLALYKVFGVTMSLSGIAGLILSIGMAVDANVLIFERIKEELHAGRDLPTAVSEGFHRAWPSIRDGHVTVLISSAILFWFSTSFIKGFALTLSIGTLVSLFSAITVTRAYIRVVQDWKWIRRSLWLFGVKKSNV